MTLTRRAAAISIAFLMTASSAFAQTTEGPDGRLVMRRAVDAAIWGLPALNFDAARQAYFRDGGAKYNDIIWWPKGSSWKNQSLTANTSVRYMYAFSNTRDDGPIVVDLPPAIAGASFYGTIEDAWFVPLVDIGFEGKGGKYLILPPNYKGDVPAGYIPVRPNTYNTMTLVRSILKSDSAEDVRNGDELVKRVKLYPLKAKNSPVQKFVDMTDILYDGLIHYDESLYTNLARVLNEEPVQPRDLEMMGMLLPLGIEKGKEFKPNAANLSQLKEAAAEAHSWLSENLVKFVTEWWPGSQWCLPGPPIAVKTEFHWETPDYFDVDSRAVLFYALSGPPAKLGSGSFYLGTYHDSSGNNLNGANTYRLRVPANVPVRQFWALTVYSRDTAALFRDSDRPTLGSLDKGLVKNADGSVDLYIGPKAPDGKEANWIYTPAGKMWFPWFRLYGPEKAVFDKIWKLPDIEKIS